MEHIFRGREQEACILLVMNKLNELNWNIEYLDNSFFPYLKPFVKELKNEIQQNPAAIGLYRDENAYLILCNEIPTMNAEELNKRFNEFVLEKNNSKEMVQVEESLDDLSNSRNWDRVINYLKDSLVINLNYGEPSSTYLPMATYRPKRLINGKNGESVDTRMHWIKPSDVLVEFERFSGNFNGEFVVDKDYKLYIPLSKLRDQKLLETAIRNADAFEQKLGAPADQKGVTSLTSGLQEVAKHDKNVIMSGLRLHREKSITLFELNACLIYLDKKVVNGEEKVVAKDISASNVSVAPYMIKPFTKKLELVKPEEEYGDRGGRSM